MFQVETNKGIEGNESLLFTIISYNNSFEIDHCDLSGNIMPQLKSPNICYVYLLF